LAGPVRHDRSPLSHNEFETFATNLLKQVFKGPATATRNKPPSRARLAVESPKDRVTPSIRRTNVKQLLELALAALLFAGRAGTTSAPAAPPPAQEARDQFRAACVTYVQECERDLAQQLNLLRTGSTSEGQVDSARLELAAARHELALSEGRPGAAADQVRLIVAIREGERDRLATLWGPGAGSKVEVLAAQRRLANARYRLSEELDEPEEVSRHLQGIIDRSQVEARLMQAQAERGVASPGDAAVALRRLAYARYLLAKGAGNTAEAAKQLRTVVEVREQDYERARRLHTRKAAPAQYVDAARVRVLEVQLRLAVLEERADAAREHLAAIIALRQGMMRRLDESPAGRRAAVVRLRWELAQAHSLMAQASEGQTPPAYNPMYELDE
jgi:hypothetical protein